MPAYTVALVVSWNYKNNPETYTIDIKPHTMIMFFIPKTWRRSNDHSYCRNNDITAPHVYSQPSC